jgi:hypothetical protein
MYSPSQMHSNLNSVVMLADKTNKHCTSAAYMGQKDNCIACCKKKQEDEIRTSLDISVPSKNHRSQISISSQYSSRPGPSSSGVSQTPIGNMKASLLDQLMVKGGNQTSQSKLVHVNSSQSKSMRQGIQTLSKQKFESFVTPRDPVIIQKAADQTMKSDRIL